MRMVSLLRPLVAAFSVGALLVAAPACKKSTPAPTEKGEVAASAESADTTLSVEGVEKAPGAITEDNDFGSITYTVAPEGQIKAVVKTSDGKPITKGVTGEFAFKVDDKETKVPATVDEKTGVIVAAGPKLEADLTPISYNLQVQGKPWTGSVEVPVGGTIALNESAKFAAANPIPAGKVGPNGGVIQVVGPDRVEVVADKGGSGQVRVYFLDPEYRVIAPPRDRRVKIAVVAETPEVIVLDPPEAEADLYLVGSFRTRVDPVRLTVAVASPTVTHTAIVGYRPGVHLVVGARAPRVRVMTATGWGPAVYVHGHGHGHGRGVVVVHDSPGVVVQRPAVVVERPSVVVRAPSVVVAPPVVGVGVGVGVGVHAGAGVGVGAGRGVKVVGGGRGKH